MKLFWWWNYFMSSYSIERTTGAKDPPGRSNGYMFFFVWRKRTRSRESGHNVFHFGEILRGWSFNLNDIALNTCAGLPSLAAQDDSFNFFWVISRTGLQRSPMFIVRRIYFYNDPSGVAQVVTPIGNATLLHRFGNAIIIRVHLHRLKKLRQGGCLKITGWEYTHRTWCR